MVKITIKTPIKAYISEVSPEEIKIIKKSLSYTNTSNAFMYKKHQGNWRWKNRDIEGWKKHGDELKASIHSSLLWEDSQGMYIRPGSIPYLKGSPTVINEVVYPPGKAIPWAKKPSFELYPYQVSSIEKLIAEKHGNVSLCTGSGKTACLIGIAQKLGLKTVLVVPSASIFQEVMEKCKKQLGAANVGGIGDGVRKLGKKITVAIGASLTRLKPGTKEYDQIASAQVLLVDESHLFAAETLEDVCHGLFANTPYRMFFSGTQTRGDGSVELLNSIIGKTVEELTTQDAIRGGYICDHEFRIAPVQSTQPLFSSMDAIEMKRIHFLRNGNIAKFIAKLANAVVSVKNESVLVLVEEMSQIDTLIPLLTVPYAEARGTGDPTAAVEAFNKGTAKVLIGSSCINTGTNIFPVHHCVNWTGGSSEIKTKQGAVGRSVRKLPGSGYEHLHPPKLKAIIWDFDVQGIETMKRHLLKRVNFYKDSGTCITFL